MFASRNIRNYGIFKPLNIRFFNSKPSILGRLINNTFAAIFLFSRIVYY
jgi:hypothetical protein